MVASSTQSTSPVTRKEPPDPAVGITMVILGIVIMGIGGAATWHYVFNIGSGIAILGAVLFVTFVTWSTYAMRGGAPGVTPKNEA